MAFYLLTNNKVFLHARKSRNSTFEIENKALKHYKKGEKHFLVPSTNSILCILDLAKSRTKRTG